METIRMIPSRAGFWLILIGSYIYPEMWADKTLLKSVKATLTPLSALPLSPLEQAATLHHMYKRGTWRVQAATKANSPLCLIWLLNWNTHTWHVTHVWKMLELCPVFFILIFQTFITRIIWELVFLCVILLTDTFTSFSQLTSLDQMFTLATYGPHSFLATGETFYNT